MLSIPIYCQPKANALVLLQFRTFQHRRNMRGISNLELICLVALLVIFSIKTVPNLFGNYKEDHKEVRIARLKALEGRLEKAAQSWRAKCLISSALGECSLTAKYWSGQLNDKSIVLKHGWPAATGEAGASQIGALVNTDAFLVGSTPSDKTTFSLVDAPNPEECRVTYIGPLPEANQSYRIIMDSSGC